MPAGSHFAGGGVDFGQLVSPRAASERPLDPTQYHNSIVILFLIFQLFGLFGGLITLVSAWNSPVVRHPTWYSFVISWVISSTSFSLLLFAGEVDNPEPRFGVCVVQAALVYASAPLNASTALGLVAQIWFSVRLMLVGTPFNGQKFWTTATLVLPYIIFIISFAEAFGTGLTQPSSVRRTGSGMFCNTGIPTPGRISAALVIASLIPVVIIEVMIIFALRRNWNTFRARENTFSLVMRVFTFTVFGVFALVMSLFFAFTIRHVAALNLVLGFIPVVAILVFGTQKDLLQIWIFWRRTKEFRGVVEEDDTPPPLPSKDVV